MDTTNIIVKTAVALAGVYFLYGVGRLLIAIFRPAAQAPINLDPIPTEFGLLTLNPSAQEENWILQQSEFPFEIRIVGITPETSLLRFLNPIMKHSGFLSREIETAGFTEQEPELHLLYAKKGTCYFDLIQGSRELQMAFSETKGAYRL
jgi:hypothetical protein